MSSATLAGRVGGPVNTGSGYCPPPFIQSNTGAGTVFSNGNVNTVTIDGINLDQVTAINAGLTAGGSPANVVIVSQSFTQIVFTVEPTAIGAHTATLVGICSNYAFNFDSQNITCLIPGQNGVNWQGIVNVNVSAGVLETVAGSGNGWNRGAHFGFAPANTEASLKFKVRTPASNANGNFGFIGLRNNAPANISFGSAGRAIYFANGSLNIYNNTASQGNFGTYVVGDEFEIRRNVAGVTEVLKNGALLFTYPTNDTGTWWFASSIFRNTAIEDIQLCHS